MDLETRTMLRRNISTWCERNAATLAAMEKGKWDSLLSQRLFEDLDGLGVIHILYEPDMPDGFAMVAETANCFARYSPSLALLVVQQNMVAQLLAAANGEIPRSWVALPLYDSPGEWPLQIKVEGTGQDCMLDGTWGTIPALPIAEAALLPIRSGDPEHFAMVRIDLKNPPANVGVESIGTMLGLRGCPSGDLRFAGASLSGSVLIGSGPAARQALENLWSQSEVFMLAIRAAILTRCYSVAQDFAAVRWQGKKIIIEHTLVRNMLAELHMATQGLDESWQALAAAVAPGKPVTAGQLGVMLRSAKDCRGSPAPASSCSAARAIWRTSLRSACSATPSNAKCCWDCRN